MTNRSSLQRGANTLLIIAFVFLSLLVLIMAGLAGWAYVNYSDQKNNVDAKIDRQVAIAEKKQADADEKKFAEREKEPNREFTGPSDYGSLSFSYPKTWSVYVAEDGRTTGGYAAYLNPVIVPPTGNKAQRFALRVSVVNEPYEDVIEEYKDQVEDGDLRTSTAKASGQSGTRLDGKFSEDIRGAAVIYKIRDKTAIVQTDADTFKADFDKIVKTITFVQ